jgi:hypothetical protein
MPSQLRHPRSWRNELLAEHSKPSQIRIHRVSARKLLPESVTLDRLVRWKSRTLKREQRLPASRSSAHPSATLFPSVPATRSQARFDLA